MLARLLFIYFSLMICWVFKNYFPFFITILAMIKNYLHIVVDTHVTSPNTHTTPQYSHDGIDPS
jgi:hypothetical protein